MQSTDSMHVGSSGCSSRAPEWRLCSCGEQVQLLHGMWNPPRPGIEPASLALQGGYLTTGPPGKASALPSFCQNNFILRVFHWSPSAPVGDSRQPHWSSVCFGFLHWFSTMFGRTSLSRKHGCHIPGNKNHSSSVPNVYLNFFFCLCFNFSSKSNTDFQ